MKTYAHDTTTEFFPVYNASKDDQPCDFQRNMPAIRYPDGTYHLLKKATLLKQPVSHL
jgi:hypothetical protein